MKSSLKNTTNIKRRNTTLLDILFLLVVEKMWFLTDTKMEARSMN